MFEITFVSCTPFVRLKLFMLNSIKTVSKREGECTMFKITFVSCAPFVRLKLFILNSTEKSHQIPQQAKLFSC